LIYEQKVPQLSLFGYDLFSAVLQSGIIALG